MIVGYPPHFVVDMLSATCGLGFFVVFGTQKVCYPSLPSSTHRVTHHSLR